jgi:dTDP-glucose 4,6-dehydratase
MLTPLERYKQIVDGTRNLLTFAADNGARRFLFSSSGAVYGPQPSHVERLAEEFRGSPPLLDPVNAYGLGKHAAEHLCVLFRDAFGLETVIARCFAFVGPDLPLDRHFAIGNFIGDALLRDSITVSGDGTPIRTYLHQDDLAHWLLAILFRGCPGEAYNVGSDVSVSMSELAGMVRDVLAPGKPVRVLAAPGADNQRSRYVPRVDKIMRELGVTECIGLREALLSTGAHHRERLGLRDP